MGRNFYDYPGFQPMRSWVNTYAQDCKRGQNKLICPKNYLQFATFNLVSKNIPCGLVVPGLIPGELYKSKGFWGTNTSK